MSLKIYNTLTRSKDVFKPLVDGKVSMYVCGMTVYDYCHIGHARVLVSFDMITRYLRSQNWDVNYVRNITDIDDKIINRANENGETFTDLTERFIGAMHEDEKVLGVARPDQEPRATAYIQDIIDMIQVLIDKDYAYTCDNGDVYYRVTKFDGYGKLSNKNIEDLLAGARVNVGDVKEDPRDFALWKGVVSSERGKEAEETSAAAGVETVKWDTPWGAGRPGWHIECSAMSKCCLGNTFDIHGGGPDLPFPHHENEIAQSEAANGCNFVNYWMHAGAVRVDGEKMSKSLGNFFTIREVLKKYHPEVVRYLLISRHYRSSINYSEDNLVEARAGLERFYTALRDFADVPAASIESLAASEYYLRFVEAMNDDFNSSVALAAMYDLVRDLNSLANGASKAGDSDKAITLAAELKAMGAIFGILQSSPEAFFQTGGEGELDAAAIETMISERVQAKADKNWGRCDEIRDELKEQGIVLEDSSEGTKWRRE